MNPQSKPRTNRQKSRVPDLLVAALLSSLAAGSAQAETYTLMIYETPAELAQRNDVKTGPAYWSAYAAYSKAMQDAGVIRGGAALAVDARVQRVSLHSGKPVNAPVAATPALGGYFVIDVPDLDTALAWAAKAPTHAAVEVHPAYPAPTMPAGTPH